MSIFTARLQKLRETSPYPRRVDFAEQCGMGKGTYNNIEDGVNLPSLEVLDRIIAAAQCDEKVASDLVFSWEKVKAAQIGIRSVRKPVDIEQITGQITRELALLLRQCHTNVAQVQLNAFKKRMTMILTAALES